MDTTDTPKLAAETQGDAVVIRLEGPWLTRTAGKLDKSVREVEASIPTQGDVVIDLSRVSRFDTAGALFVKRLHDRADAGGCHVSIAGALADSHLLKTVMDGDIAPASVMGKNQSLFAHLFESLGRATIALFDDLVLAMHILGATVRGSQLKASRGRSLSLTPIVAQIDRMGVGAVPIVVLMATIIGAIIAQQGAFQLRYFGAELYVVDLVGILVLREIGVLITAIMIAGRSGSAITAEIGSMKMREEVDALTVMGLNPIGVLVFPRLVALVIALPLLGMIANFAALAGAALVAAVYSGISLEAFITRLRDAIDLTTVFSGLIKAPFMAMIIGVISAAEGLKVEGSAESLGRCVTRSVVKSIFVVIVVDGLFAMFYAAIDF